MRRFRGIDVPRRFFSEDETDALTELVNIGVSGAAARLSRMVRRPVGLAVPAVAIVTAAQAAEMMDAWSSGPLLAVEQVFSGGLSGRALLILPANHRESLLRALVSEGEPDEALLNDALAETGNVLLHGCLGSMADLLQRPLSISVPQVVSGEPAVLLGVSAGGVVVFIYVSFDVEGRPIRGYVALAFDMPSIAELRALIQDFIERVARA